MPAASRHGASVTLPRMEVEAPTLDKSRTQIQHMFSAVAPRYDLLNRLLSARRDVAWRRAAAAALPLSPGGLALDVCCGTGDQALATYRENVRVLATDFSISMLALARAKFRRQGNHGPLGIAGDTLRLPLPSDRFAAVTASFGLRNVEDLQAALKEMLRVLRPGGAVAILEFALPMNRLLRPFYLFYSRQVLTRIGSCLSPRGSAYRYLTDSVVGFPQRSEFTAQMSAAGFTDPAWRDLSGGIVCLYTGIRSP